VLADTASASDASSSATDVVVTMADSLNASDAADASLSVAGGTTYSADANDTLAAVDAVSASVTPPVLAAVPLPGGAPWDRRSPRRAPTTKSTALPPVAPALFGVLSDSLTLRIRSTATLAAPADLVESLRPTDTATATRITAAVQADTLAAMDATSAFVVHAAEARDALAVDEQSTAMVDTAPDVNPWVDRPWHPDDEVAILAAYALLTS
jgi:hypothetical protein